MVKPKHAPKPKPRPPGRPAARGVTTTRRVLVRISPREYALLTLACPEGMTVSAWARDVLLEFIGGVNKKRTDNGRDKTGPRRQTKRRGT